MELDLNILRPEERVSLQLRLLYEKAGFHQYHMGHFEEYGLYHIPVLLFPKPYFYRYRKTDLSAKGSFPRQSV